MPDDNSDFTKDKQARIKREFNRLRRLLKAVDKDKITAVESLIRNAAFMAITLEDLQSDINQNGVISEYQNGENQWGTKKSPEVEVYNSMIKNYAGVCKQILDLLPDDTPTKADALMAFLKKARK